MTLLTERELIEEVMRALDERGNQRRHQAARISVLVHDFATILGWLPVPADE